MNYKIRIEFYRNEAGCIVGMTYTPSMLRLTAGDTVQWESPSGDFAIMFKEEGSPFTQGIDAFSFRKAPSSPMRVAENVKGQFHYAVAVFDGERVFMDAGCPVLIAN